MMGLPNSMGGSLLCAKVRAGGLAVAFRLLCNM